MQNLWQWFDVLYQQKDKVHWSIEVASLWETISWWAKFSRIGQRKRGLHHGWKKELKTFWPKLEVVVCNGF
jgi:hypothetical protein